MLKVCKFGGSSLADHIQFEKVKNIVLSEKERKVVVVSAVGKKNSKDNKVTDLLYLVASHIKYHVDYTHILNEVYDKYEEIRLALNLDVDLEHEFEIIKDNLNKGADEAYLVSRGEYLSALLMAKYLGYIFIDAKDLFRFDYNNKIDVSLTKESILQYKNELIAGAVVPGFYGINPDGAYTLFSRGGSDVSASIIASVLKADLYENFTDVPGILSADPRIIKNPKRVDNVNYEELRELSYMGASVIHEDTLLPIEELDIPINILSTNEPEKGGTTIMKNVPPSNSIITGVTGKKNYLCITITKRRDASKLLLIYQVMKILKDFQIPLEHLPTSIDSISLIVESKLIGNKLYQVVGKIKELDEVKEVLIDQDLALVAVVGRGMVTRPGISGMIFGCLGDAKINIKTIAQGAVELTIIIGVSNSDFENTIKVLYEKFVN